MPERIRLLHEVTATMSRILDLDLLLPEIAASARALGSADAASVMLVNDAGDALQIVAHQGLSDEYAAAQRIPIERARAMHAGSDRHSEIDLSADGLGDRALVARERLVRVAAMPLVRDGELIGALNIYTRDAARRFDDIDVEILHVLGAQAAVAITNARLYEAERDARQQQESLLESLGEGVVIAFPDGGVRLNRAARDIFGVADPRPSFDRVEMRRRIELRHAEGPGEIGPGDSPFDHAFRGEASSGVFSFRDLSGGVEHTAFMNVQPVVGLRGAIVAGVLTVHDLTAQREAERQKDEFLSIVSHELKTPLTPLKALAQLLRLRMRRHREDGRALDLDSLEANLRTIERQVDRMSGLVNDLLEVSRAGQGRFELQPTDFDLVPMVRDVVQRHGELLSAEGRHTFVIDAPESLIVNGDASRIEQAVTNIVGNAVKYSPRGGTVRVAVDPADGQVAIRVSDEGIGIPREDLPTLGRAFARGSQRARTFSGMGIGLYLARLVAERHGGSLDLRSEGEDRGTTVTVNIPRGGAS